MLLGGAWVCVVCWWMLDMHAFLDFFTPAFTTGVLYTPDTSRSPCPAPPVAVYSDTFAIHCCILLYTIQLYSRYTIHPDTPHLWRQRTGASQWYGGSL